MDESTMIKELSIYSGKNLRKGTLAMADIYTGNISFDTNDLTNEQRKAIVTTIKALKLEIIPF